MTNGYKYELWKQIVICIYQMFLTGTISYKKENN